MGDGNGFVSAVDRERQTFGLIVLPVWPHGDNIPEEAAQEVETLKAVQSVHLEQNGMAEELPGDQRSSPDGIDAFLGPPHYRRRLLPTDVT